MFYFMLFWFISFSFNEFYVHGYFFLHICLCAIDSPGTWKGQKKALDFQNWSYRRMSARN